MSHSALALPAEVVNELFPFHILVEKDGLALASIGSSLCRLLPVENTSGRFDQRFSIARPASATLDRAFVESNPNVPVQIDVQDSPLVLRGQFLDLESGYYLFVGSILASDLQVMKDLHVNLNMFAPIDPTPDIIILHKFKEIEKADQIRQAKKLSELSKSRDELNTYANTDELTGIANRRGFWQISERLLEENAEPGPHMFLLALLDLDKFKAINDQFGHEAGDEILCEVAERISHHVGQRGIAARIGGDEFVVLVKVESSEAQCFARSLLQKINKPLRRNYQVIDICASLGVTEIKSNQSLEQAMREADLAMYNGRSDVRGEVRWIDQALAREIEQRSETAERLKIAIEAEELFPVFQPIVKLATSDIVGFEALARWEDPELGSVSPEVFIALAEEMGLLDQLDQQILHKALDQLALWINGGISCTMHVNLSAPSLHSNTTKLVLDALNDRNLEPEHLTLELTETSILVNKTAYVSILDSLAKKGIEFQLDDFGTGYSSLSHIRDFPVSGLKIDRSFVMDANVDAKSNALLQSVMSIARHLQFDVVAEGIETAEQLAFLMGLGCQYGQGFYFGKPLPASDYASILLTGTRKVA